MALVASNGADLWDGTIQNAINLDENGNPATNLVFTGSNTDGTPSTYFNGSNALGAATGVTQTGNSNTADNTWIVNGIGNLNTSGTRFYAFSSALVVPEPASALLVLTALPLLSRRRRSSSYT